MPRKYKPKPGGKKYKKYDPLLLRQATEELTNPDTSITEIAKKYNITKSVLYRRTKRNMKPHGGQLALSLEVEEEIVKHLETLVEWGYPLNILELRYIIKMYLDTLSIKNKRFKNNFPGPDYVSTFLERHKNKLPEACQNLKRTKTKTLSTSVINKYFEKLKNSLVGVPPENILNYDETHLSTDPGHAKIITKPNFKYPEQQVVKHLESVSLMLAGTAQGELLKPYVVYKATHLKNTWVKNGPKGAKYNTSKSGRFDGEIFKDWLEEVIIPHFINKPGKKLLIGDNLSSHLSIDSIKLCKEHDINFAFIPAKSMHLTQPLDVAFFQRINCIWRQILQKWKNDYGQLLTCIPNEYFPRSLQSLMAQLNINAACNILLGFRKTGINPLDVNKVLLRLPPERYKNNKTDAVRRTVLSLLKEMQNDTKNIKTKQKRKLEVAASKYPTADCYKNEPMNKTIKRNRRGEKTKQLEYNKEQQTKNTIEESPNFIDEDEEIYILQVGSDKELNLDINMIPIVVADFNTIEEQITVENMCTEMNNLDTLDINKVPVIIIETENYSNTIKEKETIQETEIKLNNDILERNSMIISDQLVYNEEEIIIEDEENSNLNWNVR
ncbi:uncharacterized protein LOC113509745 isoform X2 [Galleria mellonella]|nr:uncharacterized protein LOC113509745 isoform X2 [Galleria mellonella]